MFVCFSYQAEAHERASRQRTKRQHRQWEQQVNEQWNDQRGIEEGEEMQERTITGLAITHCR